MRHFILLGLLLSLSWLGGCDSVTVKEPLGEAVTISERTKWIGVWGLLEDGETEANRFEVAQTKQGALVAASMQWNEDKGLFEAQNLSLAAMQLDGDLLIHARKVTDAVEKEPWTLSRYEFVDHDTVRVFVVNFKPFKEAVEKGTLKGNVEKGKHSTKVTLSSGKADIETFLRKVGVKACFLEKPITLKRI